MMQIILSIVPFFIVMFFFFIKKIKITNFDNLVFWGIISFLLAIAFNALIDNYFHNLNFLYWFGDSWSQFLAFLVIGGVVEEGAKYLALKFSKPKTKKQIFVNMLFIALIFCILEDFFYLKRTNYFWQLALYRILTPFHLVFAVVMSFFLAKAYDNPSKTLIYNGLALVIPIVIHGYYDYIFKDFKFYNLSFFLILILGFLVYGLIFAKILKLSNDEEVEVEKPKKMIVILKNCFSVLFILFYVVTFWRA